MRRAANFSQEYDWEQKTSHVYHERVTQGGKSPNVMTNIPHQHRPYDHVNGKVFYDQHGGGVFNTNHHHGNHNHHYPYPPPKRKTQYVEHEEVTRFPNVYKAFSSQVPNHQAIYEIKYDNHLPRVNHQKHQPPAPETRKNVHFIDLEKRTTEVDRKGKSEVHKDFDVNQAADRFINQNRKKFERSTLKSI